MYMDHLWCNTVWNAAPPIDGIRPNGQNLPRNILTSLNLFLSIIIMIVIITIIM